MNNKVVWSNTQSFDNLIDLSAEELRNELINLGYDPEMLAGLSDDELRDVVVNDSDDLFHGVDYEDFEYNIAPMISSQTRDGIVLMAGKAGRWNGNYSAGKAVYAEELADCLGGCDNIRIEDVDGGLVWFGCHHDGCHTMGLYAIPEDENKLRDFVRVCFKDYLEDNISSYDYTEQDVEDPEVYETEGIIENLSDVDFINNFCDFSEVPAVCEPIRNTMGVEESCEEALTEDEEVPEEPIEEPELPDIEEPIEEPKKKKSKIDLDALSAELESLKSTYEDEGNSPDFFYAVPLKSFKREFPVFYDKVLMHYLKRFVQLEPEELADEAELNKYWANGELIQPTDWPVLFEGAAIMLKGNYALWDKIYKKYSDVSSYLK